MKNGDNVVVLAADTVVLAVGAQSVNYLAAELAGKAYKVTTVGDALGIHQALETIEEGYVAGMNISSATIEFALV